METITLGSVLFKIPNADVSDDTDNVVPSEVSILIGVIVVLILAILINNGDNILCFQVS